MSRFDRIKAPEQRLRARPEGTRLDSAEADADGRAALYSQTRPAVAERSSRPSVHCSRCEQTSLLDAATALRSALPLVLVAPWRDHPVFAVCPACRRRSWLRPRLGA